MEAPYVVVVVVEGRVLKHFPSAVLMQKLYLFYSSDLYKVQ